MIFKNADGTGDRAELDKNFEGLVLGCVDADVRNQIRILQHFLISKVQKPFRRSKLNFRKKIQISPPK